MSTKACKKCGKELPLEAYYQDRSRSDGRRNTCSSCDRARKASPEAQEQSRRYYHSEKGKAAERRYVESGRKAEAETAYRLRPEVRDRKKAYQREYQKAYQQTPQYREWLRQHMEKPEVRAHIRQRLREWYAANRDRLRNKARLKDSKRRAQKARSPLGFHPEDWQNCLTFFEHTCAYCGSSGPLGPDHFIPLASGGDHSPENIVPACQPCNLAKNAKDPLEWSSPEALYRILTYFGTLEV